MSHPAARVLGLLELLQSQHRLTGAELSARLGVDERTVRRYARTLAELGIPVTAARGRYGGYRLLPGYKLPPLMLTDDEAVAVVLGLVAAEQLGLGTEAPATAVALGKISRVLPEALADRLAAVRQTLGFTLRRRTGTAGPDTTVLLTLGAATRSRRRVTLDYRSWRGEESRRDLDPYGLVFHAGRWYVTGHDHRRGEIRTFRLDRIAAVEPSADGEAGQFTVPDGFDPVGPRRPVAGRSALRLVGRGAAGDRPDRGPPPDPGQRGGADRGAGRGAAARPRGEPGRDGATARRARLAVHRRTARTSCAPRSPSTPPGSPATPPAARTTGTTTPPAVRTTGTTTRSAGRTTGPSEAARRIGSKPSRPGGSSPWPAARATRWGRRRSPPSGPGRGRA